MSDKDAAEHIVRTPPISRKVDRETEAEERVNGEADCALRSFHDAVSVQRAAAAGGSILQFKPDMG